MKYEDVLKRFVSTQAQLLQEKQMRQQQREQMLAEKAQGLQSFVPGMQGHSPEEEYTESEHNPFEETQEYENGGDFDKPRFSLGMYASPEMGSSVSPSLNFERGNFNANLSTNIPIETPNRYSKNLNVDANYNTGKFGNIGVSGSAYRNEEGLPAYNAGFRYELPINDKLNFMLNADTSSFKNLKDNANVSAGLRYTFEDGGDMIRRADGSYSKRGLWDNIRDNAGSGKAPTKEMLEQERRINNKYPDGGSTKTVKSEDGTITNVKQNADGSKTVQVRTKDGKYYEKVIPMDYWGELETAKNNYNDEATYEKALNYSGVAAYPASIVSSMVDAYDGNYGDAAIGLIPFIGKQARGSQLLRRNAYTGLVNSGVPHKLAKHVRPAIDYTTKALGLGAAGYDLSKEEDGGPARSIVENTSGPRADEMGNPMDYLSFINSEEYTGSMSDNEALFNPATGLGDKVYRQEGNPMSIDYIKSRLADKTVIKTPYNNLDPVHRYYDTELINSSRDAYDTHKQSHLKHKVEGNIQDYADIKDVVKGAHDHNLKNGYDDTDKITSYFGDQAKKEGLDIYDFMAKYYGGSSPNAVARQLLVDYSKKMKK